MAQETVTRSCGCSERVNLLGKSADRDSRREWLKRTPCAEHYRERETAVAAERANDTGLPALVGSEKQVAWAITLREKRLGEIEKGLVEWQRQLDAKRADSAPGLIEAAEHNLGLAQAALETLRGETAARFWIDTQHEQWRQVILKLIPEDRIRKMTEGAEE